MNFLLNYFNYKNNFSDPLEQFEVVWFTSLVNSYSFLLLLNFFLLMLFFHNFSSYNVFQFFLTQSLIFVKDLYISIFGDKNYGYFYLFYLIFLIILTANLVGLLPWSFTTSSVFLLPLFFSFIIFGGTVFVGFETYGLQFLNLFYPKGTPKPILNFLIIIEVFSYFIRLISLSVRLFANMVAGHALIKILISFSWSMLCSGAVIISFFGLFVWVLIIAITVLEVLISFLQAYVFTFLGMIYLHEIC